MDAAPVDSSRAPSALPQPGELWDFSRMLELNGAFIIDSIAEMRRIKTIIEGFSAEIGANAEPEARTRLRQDVGALIDSLGAVGANTSLIAADRLDKALEDNTRTLTWKAIRDTIQDIESRFRDELSLVRLFVLHSPKAGLFREAGHLAGWEVADNFPSATFEIEEAAKCLALGRATACAFHSMRVLEIGIRALAKYLEIPDPTKPAERNWAIVLKAIRDEIDKKWPVNKRLPTTDGARAEALFATLDAVKNPWRNATMHVEAVYTEADANHVLNCVIVFMQKLAAICDEDGIPMSL